MSLEPVDPKALAEHVVLGELCNVMLENADRFHEIRLDGTLQSLIPNLSIRGNSTLGLMPQNFEPHPQEKLSPSQRVFGRLWFMENVQHDEKSILGLTRAVQNIQRPVSYACLGNRDRIIHCFTMDAADQSIIVAAVKSAMPEVEVQFEPDLVGSFLHLSAGERFSFRSLMPSLPYWGQFISVIQGANPFLHALLSLIPPSRGFYQVVFRPISSRWSSTLRTMARAEKLVKNRYADFKGWLISDDNDRTMEAKLAGPLFAVVVRLALVTQGEDEIDPLMNTLMIGTSHIQFSGCPFQWFTDRDLWSAGVDSFKIRECLLEGTSFHHGSIMSADELAVFFNLPVPDTLKDREIPLDRVPEFTGAFPSVSGLVIGQEDIMGKSNPVVWPEDARTRHMIISGATGFGKTSFLSRLAACIVNEHPDEGLAMIDPHRMAIHEFLQAIDESRIPDCILHDPADPDYVLALPLFPLFEGDDNDQIDAATANIAHSLFALFPRHELGFHMEKGITNLVRTIVTVPDLSLVEARTLLDRGHKGAALREKICFQVKDPILVEYWSQEFGVIDKATGARIKSRVDRLFESRRLLPLFANKLKRISYAEIVSSNKIFLACTSVQSGPDLASILGAIHLTALQTAAFSRNPTGGAPSTFTLFVDEFGNYSNPATMGHFLRTLRKYGISQVLATQDIEALPPGIKEAIGNINTHIIFCQGWSDAQHYAKYLNNRVPINDFTSIGIGEAFVKMGGQFAKLRTQLSSKKRGLEILEELRRLTREKYCIPTQEVMAQLCSNRRESALALDNLKSLDQF